MRSNRTMMFAGVIGGMAAAMAAAAPMEPDAEPAPPGSARHKPSGSKPVPGGGARERERRLARMVIEGFEGPKADGEPVLCTGCWDESDNNPEADNYIKPGDPVYFRLVNIEYDEWDAHCEKHARAYANQTF